MIYFISDTHFGHANILKHDNRPFATIGEHDRTLLNNINETVSPGDALWLLGDVAWSQVSFQWCLENIREDSLISYSKGNHDKRWGFR